MLIILDTTRPNAQGQITSVMRTDHTTSIAPPMGDFMIDSLMNRMLPSFGGFLRPPRNLTIYAMIGAHELPNAHASRCGMLTMLYTSIDT